MPDRSEASGSADPLRGTRYRTVGVLGEGGFSEVYLAEHRDLGRVCAVKVLPVEFTRDVREVERLRREARTVSQIHHPGIVEVTDFGETLEGRPFVVMEYLEGEDLETVLGREGHLGVERALRIAIGVADALHAAHGRGVIHRDIKPANIVLLGSGEVERVKVVDFGIALSLEHERQRLTEPGYTPGTPTYMAPEQVRSRSASVLSDVYSLGVVLYEMLTGSPPFAEPSGIETLVRKLHDPPEPPSRRAPGHGIGAEVEKVILKALATDPLERYQDMAELGLALTSALEAHRWGDTGSARRRGWRALRWIASATLSAFVATAAVTYVAVSRRDQDRGRRAEPRASASLVAPDEPADGALPGPAEGLVPAADAGAADGVVREEAGSGQPAALLEPVRIPVRVSARPTGQGGAAPPGRPPADGSAEGPRRDAGSRRESLDALVAEGDRLLRSRRLDEAARAFEAAAELAPGSPAVEAGLGRVAFERGNHSAAAAHLERALARRPGDVGLRLLLGSTYLRLGQRDRAVREWQQVQSMDPDNAAAARLLETVQ